MAGCGTSLQIFPVETQPTQSWRWTATPTRRTFKSPAGKREIKVRLQLVCQIRFL